MIKNIVDSTNGISADYVYGLRYDKRTGKITCTCQGFCFDAGKGKICHHVREFLELLKEKKLI